MEDGRRWAALGPWGVDRCDLLVAVSCTAAVRPSEVFYLALQLLLFPLSFY